MYEKYDYLVVGAGFYGATFANLAARDGKKVLVIDKRAHIGGNAFTNRINGIDVHEYGPHIFHTNNEEVWRFVNEFGKFNRFTNSPVAVFEGERYNLPFNMNTFTKIFGGGSPRTIREKIEKDKGKYANIEPTNLEEQAIKMVGKTIYKMLVKGYTEKQWGRLCKELPPSIIKRLPLRFTYDNCYFDDLYQGIPVDGYTHLICNMLENCDVEVNTPYTPEMAACAKRIVWTGPIDEYFGYKYGPLEYRSLRFEHKIIQRYGERDINELGCAVTNYTSKDVPYTRAIEHKHFNPNVFQTGTVISYEYSYEWEPGVEPYYPIGDTKNLELYEKYKALADAEEKVMFGGRLGTYKYLNMDQVIRDAIEDYCFASVSD